MDSIAYNPQQVSDSRGRHPFSALESELSRSLWLLACFPGCYIDSIDHQGLSRRDSSLTELVLLPIFIRNLTYTAVRLILCLYYLLYRLVSADLASGQR